MAFVRAAVLHAASGYLLKALAIWRVVHELAPEWVDAARAVSRIEEVLGLGTGTEEIGAPAPVVPGVRERIAAAFPAGAEVESPVRATDELDVLDRAAFRAALGPLLLRALDDPTGGSSRRLLRHLCAGPSAEMRSDCLGSQIQALDRDQLAAVVAFLEHQLAQPWAEPHAIALRYALDTIWRPLARIDDGAGPSQ